MKLVLTASFVFFIVFALTVAIVPKNLSASNASISLPTEGVKPGDGVVFVFRRLAEKTQLMINSPFPNRKEKLYEELSSRRLAELKYIVENKQISYFENATTRYSTTVGNWVEYIKAKQLDGQEQSTIETLSFHLPVLENLMTKYDPTTAEWRFIKHDSDYVQLYINKLRN